MSQEKFYELLDTIRPDIEKQDTTFTLAIPSEKRLATCLRYNVESSSGEETEIGDSGRAGILLTSLSFSLNK
ncbi:hypothetical protein ACI65C_006844 [Semiaphis heraclei]